MSSYYKITEFQKKVLKLTNDNMYPLIVLPNHTVSKLEETISLEEYLDYCRKKKGDLPCLRSLKKPVEPTKPHLNEIPKTQIIKVPESFWKSTNWHLIVYWFVAATILGAIFGFSEWGILGALLFYLLWVPVLIIILTRCGEKQRIEKKEIPYTKEEVEIMLREEQDRYQKEVEEYPQKMADYTAYEDWYFNEMVNRQGILEECINPYLSQLLKSFFVKSEDYEVVDDPPQKGRSEDLLFASVYRRRRESVHMDTKICGKYPDLMISTKNDVYIDVEIDEPYEMESKKEIHYIGGEDEDRNALLAQKEWVVIRFSEKQIMTNCNACTNLINKMVEVIENGEIQSLDELISIKNSIKENRWRKEDARMMAINNERNTYPGSKTIINNNTSKRSINYYKVAKNSENTKKDEYINDGLPF